MSNCTIWQIRLNTTFLGEMNRKYILSLVMCLVFYGCGLIQAFCIEIGDPEVFRIYGTNKKKVVIEGSSFKNLLQAISSGKDVDIRHAVIKGDIDLTDLNLFSALDIYRGKVTEVPIELIQAEQEMISGRGAIEEKLIIIKGNISIQNSVLNGRMQTYNERQPGIIDRGVLRCSFRKSLILSGTRLNGPISFRDALFNGGNSFWDTQFCADTNFGGARFNRDVSFREAHFDSVVSFSGTQFMSNAYFDNARFSTVARFSGAKFNDDVYFNRTQFSGAAEFTNAMFFRKADFGHVKFVDATFKSALFGIKSPYSKMFLCKQNMAKVLAKETGGDIKNIESSRWIFLGSSRKSLITGETQYQYSFHIFPKEHKSSVFIKDISKFLARHLSAYKAAGSPTMCLGKKDKVKAFRDQYASRIDFFSATFSKSADFRHAFFLADVNFKDANFMELALFEGCSFFNAKKLGLVTKNNQYSIVDLYTDKTYFNRLSGLSFRRVVPHFQKRLNNLDKKSMNPHIRDSLIERYIYLQETFRKIGMFEDADLVYYERKVLEAQKEIDNWVRFWNWFLDTTCRYGTDFKQVVKTSLYIVIFFTLLYWCTIFSFIQVYFGTIEVNDADKWIKNDPITPISKSEMTSIRGIIGTINTLTTHLWRAFYLSVNTFTTVGTGDIIATRLFRVLVLIEGSLGWFMLGLFIVVFSAKYLR